MNKQSSKTQTVFFIMSVLALILFSFSGCKKEGEITNNPPPATNNDPIIDTTTDTTTDTGLVLGVISGDTSESGSTATFTVQLKQEPTADVVLAITSDNPAEGTASPSSMTFTPLNWDVNQTVTVAGVDDAVVDGDKSYFITLMVSLSDDIYYGGTLKTALVNVTNQDDDIAGVSVSSISGSTGEDGTAASFTVVLTSQPTADVTIALSSDNPAEGTVMPASLTFTSLDWSTAQTVTVTGVDDILIDGSQSYNIITAATVSQDADYNGINPDDVAVTNVDNDSPGMLVGNISGDTTEAGSTATFTVRLATGPAADVTLSVLSDSLSEGTVSPASLTFTSANWSTAQTVTVTGVDDFIADGDQAYQIWIDPSGSVDASYKTLANIQVPVTNLDDDVAGFSISAGSGNTTDNGGTASFSVSLTSEPTSNVTVNVSSDNTAEGTIGITSLTFTPADWAGTHLVMVTGAGDNYADGDQSYNIVLAAATSLDPVYNGMNPPDKPMINEDTFVLKMPDTGQTSCFDQAGTLITCPAANQVLEQDGTYPKNPLSYTDNGDLTVTDNNTGLMWQKDIDATTRGWNTAATYCTNLATGGYNDWRLPDIRELVSLVNFQNMNPAISAADFPGTALSSYWSNTTHAGNPGSALTVSFAAGVKSFQTKPTPLNVRCVRGVQVLTPAFVDNGDGTITDNTTGLMWMKDDDATGPQTWETAVHTCGAALGYFDWRLPNIKELQTIIKESQIAAPVIDSAFFPTAAADYYWSSTNNMGLTTEAWAVWFQDGKALNKPKSALYRARCVRL